MKRGETIKSKQEFSEIINLSKYIKNSDYIIYYRKRVENKSRFGIAISNKIGNAVMRNKLKRQTREIIRKLKYLFKNDYDYIIMIRKGSLESNFHDRFNNLERLLNKEKI